MSGKINYKNTCFFVILLLLTIFTGCNNSGNESKTGVSENKTPSKGENPVVNISTNYGDIKVQLNADKAPITVENFISYVKDGFYDNTIFHRVIPGFMIQGGGFTEQMQQKETKAPIKNEADNGLKNEKGTIAMARTSEVNSATSQFFINLADNDFLNHGSRDFGYAVFGKVIIGMDVVENIGSVKTVTKGYMQNVPKEPVVIKSIIVVDSEN